MRVYQLVLDRFGGMPADVSFQSSNRWDIAGAKAFGFRCVWMNRTGAPDEYPELPPDRVVRDLPRCWSNGSPLPLLPSDLVPAFARMTLVERACAHNRRHFRRIGDTPSA